MLKLIGNTISLNGRDLIGQIRELSEDATIKRLVIKDELGDVAFVVPLGLGIFGIALNPILAAIVAGALNSRRYTIQILRKENI